MCALIIYSTKYVLLEYCTFGLKKLTNLIENDCWCWYREQGLRYFCIFRYIFRN